MILISVLSLIIGLLYLAWFRSKDLYEPEPWLPMIIAMLAGGALSVFISLFIYNYIPLEQNFLDAFGVGLIEEFGKGLAFVILLPYLKKEMNELVDGVIYMSSVALGFAVIENVFYAISSDSPYQLLAMRALTSTIGHISFSAFMGAAVVIHLREAKNYIGILWSYLFASALHGLYDAVLFEVQLNIFFSVVYIGGAIVQYNILKLLLSYSLYRPPFDARFFIPSPSPAILTCPHCGNEKNLQTGVFVKIEKTSCPNCGRTSLDSKSTRKAFSYFRPLYKWNEILKRSKGKGNIPLNDLGTIYFKLKGDFLVFEEGEFKPWVFQQNVQDRNQLILHRFYQPITKLMGFEKIVEREYQE